MKKTLLLLLIVGLILILASGSLCGCSMRKSFLMMDDESIANKQFEKLIDAIQTQDIDAVRALFSASFSAFSEINALTASISQRRIVML